jgi:hypothetical protein
MCLCSATKAFKVIHDDCLDDYPPDRDAFWQSLSSAGASVYFSGHDHLARRRPRPRPDGNADNDLVQMVVGTGEGRELPPTAEYSGNNSSYTLTNTYREVQNGYRW